MLRRAPASRAIALATVLALAALCAGCGNGAVAGGAAHADTTAPSGAGAQTGRTSTSSPSAASIQVTDSGATVDGRVRVLFVGDSITFGAQYELQTALAAHDIETHFVGFPSTGLLTDQDLWTRSEQIIVSRWHPDIVVIEACCNYAEGSAEYRLPDGSTVAPDTEQMYDLWTEAAQRAVRIGRSEGAQVRWVVMPDTGPGVAPAKQTRIARFEAIAEAQGVPMIDWRTPLDVDGHYARTIEQDGVEVPIRQLDDLHLTDSGDVLITAATWKALAPVVSAIRRAG